MESFLKYGRIMTLMVCFSMPGPTTGQAARDPQPQSPAPNRIDSPAYAAPNGPAAGGNPACAAGAGDCCVEGGNGTPGCDDALCCNTVCATDAFCCDGTWDETCADAAQDLCGVLCTCGNGTCDPGEDNTNCPQDCPCGDGTCDPDEDISTCPQDCCGDPGSGDCCMFNGSTGCNDADCCNVVCAADPFCCDTSWDKLCAAAAQKACSCPACGNPDTGDCCMDTGTPFCDDQACCNTVCAADAFCCDVEWDGICADAAQKVCSTCCPPCRDFNADGVVEAFDLAAVLAAWGDPGCSGTPPCCQDEDGDGDVDAGDLADVLATWGLCPL